MYLQEICTRHRVLNGELIIMRAEKIEAFANDLADALCGKWEDNPYPSDTVRWVDTKEKVKAIIRKHCNKN